MRTGPRFGAAHLFLLALWSSACGLPDAPEAPVSRAPQPLPQARKVVFRDVSPGVDPTSPAGQPVTLYRLGQRWGRVEYPPDRARNKHPLVVVNEPDIWIMDRAEGVGRRLRDAGPSYVFHAPVIEREAASTYPQPVRQLEFGGELEFVRAHGARPQPARSENGVEIDHYQVDMEDAVSVILVTPRGVAVPLRLGIFRDQALERGFEYLEYRDDVPASPEMFQPPPGIRIVESPEAAPQPGPAN